VPLGHVPHRSLASGDIDLALTGFDPVPEQIHHDLLFEDTFVCVMRAGHPLAEADADVVSLAGFLAYPHLALSVSDAELDRVAMELGAEARHRKVAARVPYFALAPRMLAAGDLVMVVPARAAAGWSAGEQEQCALAVRRARGTGHAQVLALVARAQPPRSSGPLASCAADRDGPDGVG
jgi:DNA-binding transcriptional LysR family regulator